MELLLGDDARIVISDTKALLPAGRRVARARCRVAAWALLAVVAAGLQSLLAQTVVTWGNTGSANLNHNNNWVGGSAPTSTQIASFASASFAPAELQLNNQSITVLGIQLEAGAGSLTFSSPGNGGAKTITVGSAGIANYASSSLLTVDISSKVNIALSDNSRLTSIGELWITDSTSSLSGFAMGAFTLTLDGTFGANFSTDGQRSGIAKAFTGTGNIVKTGSGTYELTGANVYTGSTTISGGKLSVGILANGGEWSGIGKSSAAASNLVFDGGTLVYTGGNTSTDRLFTLGANGGGIEAGTSFRNSTGALVFSSTGSIFFSGTNTSPTFTLSGVTSGNVFAPVLGDNGTGHTSLVKSGTGSWSLTSAQTFTGGLSLLGGTLTIGSGGSLAAANTVTINGGTLTLENAAQDIALLSLVNGGLDGLSSVKLKLAGSGWTGGQLGGSGSFTVDTGASLTVSGVVEHNYNSRTFINRGTVNWSGGDLRSSAGSSFTNYGTLNDSAAASHTHSGSGSFTNATGGTYNKTGAGTTTFDVPFTNSGTLIFGGGNLIFNGGFTNAGGSFGGTGGSVQSTTPIDFASNSTLGGNSVITAPSVTTSGRVAPGNSAGLITINGNLTLLAGSQLIIELGGTAQGTSYDALVVNGTVVLGASLSLSFANNFQSFVQPTDTFTIVQANNVNGAFTNVAHGQRISTTDNFGSFQVNYGTNSTFGSGNVVLSNFVPVPEPSTWQLLGGGALLALLARWRIRRRYEK